MRLLALVFGVTVHAASTVLAAFMTGLALGSATAGRFADRVTRPLVVFAAAEALVAVAALATPVGLSAVEALYVRLYPALSELAIRRSRLVRLAPVVRGARRSRHADGRDVAACREVGSGAGRHPRPTGVAAVRLQHRRRRRRHAGRRHLDGSATRHLLGVSHRRVRSTCSWPPARLSWRSSAHVAASGPTDADHGLTPADLHVPRAAVADGPPAGAAHVRGLRIRVVRARDHLVQDVDPAVPADDLRVHRHARDRPRGHRARQLAVDAVHEPPPAAPACDAGVARDPAGARRRPVDGAHRAAPTRSTWGRRRLRRRTARLLRTDGRHEHRRDLPSGAADGHGVPDRHRDLGESAWTPTARASASASSTQ